FHHERYEVLLHIVGPTAAGAGGIARYDSPVEQLKEPELRGLKGLDLLVAKSVRRDGLRDSVPIDLYLIQPAMKQPRQAALLVHLPLERAEVVSVLGLHRRDVEDHEPPLALLGGDDP